MLNDNIHKTLHILVSGFTSNYGGVETFLFQHFKHMDHDKVHIDVVTHTKNPAFKAEIEAMGSKFFYIPVRNKYPLKYKKALKEFFKDYAKDYDVFWCNKCMLNNIDLLKYATKYQIPVRILHSHCSSNMNTGIKGRIMQIMHNRNKGKIASYVTKYWACSDYAAKWLFPPAIMERKSYTFIPNAVDGKKFRINDVNRRRMREQLGLDGSYVIGHIGRFNYSKNHEFLIRVFQKVHEQDANTKLILIGKGELESTVRKQVESLKLEGAVQFLGVRHDIPEIMQAIDCFVLPSRFEGLPVVAVEAQAAGVPCVLARDGITEQVKITNSVEFMNLEQSVDEWAKEILKQANKREDNYQVIKDRGFNIDEAAVKLMNVLYCNME